MSRTDKDRPTWVRRRDTTTPVRIEHDHHAGVCDADPGDGSRCCWTLPPWIRRDSSLPPPPNRLANAEWWRPERTRERDALRDLAREYNADPEQFMDEDDADFEHRQGRHWVHYHYW